MKINQKEKINIELSNQKGVLMFKEYPNKRLAIIFIDDEDKEYADFGSYETLTVNLPDYDLSEDEVFLNINGVYGEEIIEIFQNLGFIEKIIGYEQSGFLSYPKIKLKENIMKVITKE